MAKAGKRFPTSSSPTAVNPAVWAVVVEINNKLKALDKFNALEGSVKQRQVSSEEMVWITNWLITGDVIEASFTAYPDKMKNKMHARFMGEKKLQKPAIQQAIGKVMEANGEFTNEKLLSRIADIIYRSENESNSVAMIKEVLKMIPGAYVPERVMNVNVNADISANSTDAELLETISLLTPDQERGISIEPDRGEEVGASISDELTA